MAVEFEDTGLVMDGVKEAVTEAIEDVGKYAYEIIGSVMLRNLETYTEDYTEEFLNSLTAEGILVATDDPEPGYQWYRVTTPEEREEA